MTWTPTTLTVKDANGTSQPLVAYTDGTNFSFAHPLLDNTGAAVSPATSGKQDTGNASLATIAAAAGLSSTSALQTSGNTILSAIQAQLAGTVSVAVTGTPALAAGAATSALQTTGNTSLAAIATNTANVPAKGAATSANSLPVVIASDQGALPLPTGAATAANQTSGNTSLATIATNTAGLATSVKQDTGNAALASLVAAGPTAALQTTGNTSLSAIATSTANIPAKGPAASANSTPVVIASDQAAVPVSAAANTSGGASTYAATGGTGNALLTNAPVAVKASAGNLYGFDFVNTGASAAYVQLFDAAQGSVTLGTTPPKLSKWVAAGGSWEEKFGGESKISFSTAITAAATATPTGNAAPGTGVLANFIYK